MCFRSSAGQNDSRLAPTSTGNIALHLDRLLTAPATEAHGRTFYLADPVPIEVAAFAAIRRGLGFAPPRLVPVALMARSGDPLKAAHVAEPPLTSSRLRHLRMDLLAG
jgi:hypothetical protein